jgi:hypothetical protein
MIQYEYLRVDLPQDKLPFTVDELNEYGKEGWQLVSFSDRYCFYLFVREIEVIEVTLEID